MEEKSRRRNHGGEIMEEGSWRRNHRGHLRTEGPRRHPEAFRKHPAGTQESPKRHPGGSQCHPEAHAPSDTQEAARGPEGSLRQNVLKLLPFST